MCLRRATSRRWAGFPLQPAPPGLKASLCLSTVAAPTALGAYEALTAPLPQEPLASQESGRPDILSSLVDCQQLPRLARTQIMTLSANVQSGEVVHLKKRFRSL